MINRSSCCGIHTAAQWLLVIGGINWGLIGALNYNLVEAIFGGWDWLVRLIYILVGLAAIAALFQSGCAACKNGTTKM